MSLIQMSVSGAVLILAIMVIRAVAIDRLPKETFRGLWVVALFRLLLPISIPLPFSLYPLFPPNSLLGEWAAASGPTAPAMAAGTPISLLTVIWGVGAALSAGIFLLSWLRCRREFLTSLLLEYDFTTEWLHRHPLRREIRLRQLDGLPTPLTYGLLHPVILLPEDTDWEDTRSLDYILFHEYIHIHRWDGVLKLAAVVALCVHWVNPMVWILYILLNRDIELACDAAVLRRFGMDNRASYARVLIGMKENGRRFDPLSSHFGQNAAEERITSVMKFRRASAPAVVLALILVAAAFMVFATTVEPAAVAVDIPSKTGSDTARQNDRSACREVSARILDGAPVEFYVENEPAKIMIDSSTSGGYP